MTFLRIREKSAAIHSRHSGLPLGTILPTVGLRIVFGWSIANSTRPSEADRRERGPEEPLVSRVQGRTAVECIGDVDRVEYRGNFSGVESLSSRVEDPPSLQVEVSFRGAEGFDEAQSESLCDE